MERHDRRLDEEAAADQRERATTTSRRRARRERLADLREVQRARARRTAARSRTGSARPPTLLVTAKVERALRAARDSRCGTPVSAYADDAHQLEEDEQVEQVARSARTRPSRRGTPASCAWKIGPTASKKRHANSSAALTQHRGEQRRAPAPSGSKANVDAERDSVRARLPAAEPGDDRRVRPSPSTSTSSSAQNTRDRRAVDDRHERRRAAGGAAATAARTAAATRNGRRRRAARAAPRQSRSGSSSSGSSVPKRLCACTAIASSSAVTVAADDDVGQRQRLDHGVDRRRAARDVDEDGAAAPCAVADRRAAARRSRTARPTGR